MAVTVYAFDVTTPAGTPIDSPQVLDVPVPVGTLDQVDVIAPAGLNGAVGFALGAAGVPVIPFQPGQWIVTSGENLHFTLTDQIDSGAWQLFTYNVGLYDHTLHLRFQITPPGVGQAAASPSLIGAAQLSGSTAVATAPTTAAVAPQLPAAATVVAPPAISTPQLAAPPDVTVPALPALPPPTPLPAPPDLTGGGTAAGLPTISNPLPTVDCPDGIGSGTGPCGQPAYGDSAPTPGGPTAVSYVSLSDLPLVTGLPVDAIGNSVAYDSTKGGSIEIPNGSGSAYVNLPPGWSLATVDPGTASGPGTTLTPGTYAVPPGVSDDLAVVGPDYNYPSIPAGWQLISGAY